MAPRQAIMPNPRTKLKTLPSRGSESDKKYLDIKALNFFATLKA
jgi:hypothetical protein